MPYIKNPNELPKKIAFYGILRNNQDEFLTLLGKDLIPGTMWNVNGSFPAWKKTPHSNVGVTVEVYAINNFNVLRGYDAIEGYDPDETDITCNLYVRRIVRSPTFGSILIYEYNHSCFGLAKVQSGDWLEYTKRENR